MQRERHTTAATYLDCLSAELVATGYKPATIQRYLRAAAHVSYWHIARTIGSTERAQGIHNSAALRPSDVARVKTHAVAADAEFTHFLDVAPSLHQLCIVGLSETNDIFSRINSRQCF